MQTANRKTREAHGEWIESALLAAESLYTARRELKHDTAFGQWCEANRLGFDLFSKDERAALIKIGADLPYWRETLAKTESRSLRLIVQREPPPGIATAAIPPRHATKPGPKPATRPSTGAASSPKPSATAKTYAQPKAKTILRTFTTPNDGAWNEVVPREDAEKVVANFDKLLGQYDDLLEVYDLVATDCNELQRRLNMLVEAVKTTGLLPIKNEDGPEPKIVIADLDKTNAWLEGARADWRSDRMRCAAAMFVNLPPEASWKEIMPHYREEDSSESETPPAEPASA